MSFARTKSNRFGDKIERPTTAVGSGARQTPSSVGSKSFIPKFRSLSQPPSVQSMKDSPRSMGDQIKEQRLENSMLGGDEPLQLETTINEQSAKSEEEFRDCPESKIEDFKEVPIVSEISAKTENAVPRRNSSSGIPVKSQTPRNAGKPSTARMVTKSSTPRSIAKKSGSTLEKPQMKRNFDLFTMKKKHLEQMRKDVVEKQKPLIELYQTVQQLKKKLDEGGRIVALDPINIVEFEDISSYVTSTGGGNKQNLDISAGGENPDSPALQDLKREIQDVWHSLATMYKSSIEMRTSLFTTMNLDDMDKLKEQSETIDRGLKRSIDEQESCLDELMGKLNQQSELFATSGSKEMLAKIHRLEVQLKETSTELQKTKQQVKDKVSAENALFDEENGKLKERVHQLEKQLDSEKRKHQHEVEKFKNAELSMKTFKSKIKDYDSSKQQYDSRISQLSQDLRNAQLKIKQMEKNYEKEIAELNKSRHLDKSVIERMNKDRSTFETRLQTATDTIETIRLEAEQREAELQEELEAVRNEADVSNRQIVHLEKECELLQKEINSLEMHTQNAADVIHEHRRGGGTDGKPETDRECELQIEVVAQRAAIRALQEKVEANATEKLRFIETIEKMNGTPEGIQDSIVKSLVKKEEDLTRFEQLLRKQEDIISKQKLEIDTLYAKQDHLHRQIAGLTVEENGDELKSLLKEGKVKLEQALMKSLENEHKIIKYEHELGQKNQAIANLENLMKVRDGLIGVMKAKKDEIAMENQSLTKYSEEIRTFVLEIQNQLKDKSEIIQELQGLVDSRSKENHKHEKRIRELEEKLAMTNEKRYKLQDTVGYMEKELQATKAQMNQIEDMQTRYELGGGGRTASDNTAIRPIGLHPWTTNSVQIQKRYKSAYEQQQQQQPQQQQQLRVDDDIQRSPPQYMMHRNSAYVLNGSGIEQNASLTVLSIKSSVTRTNRRVVQQHNQQLHQHQRQQSGVVGFQYQQGECCSMAAAVETVVDQQQHHHEMQRCGDVAHCVPCFNCPPRNPVFGAGQEYRPLVFRGVDRYKVSRRGNLLWCRPSYEMKANNMLITKDLIAHSCSRIKQNLDNSLKLLNEKKATSARRFT